MVVFNIPSEADAIAIKLNTIFVILIGVEVATIRANTNNGYHAKERGCEHSAGKLKGIGGAFLIVKGRDQHLLAVRRAGS